MSRNRLRIFRWRAVGPLLLVLLLLLVLWLIFGDTLVRKEAEASLTESLGTEVDIARLAIRETDAAVDLGGLAIADPRDPRRNLVEAGAITVAVDPVPLTEKKLVINDLRLSGLRFLTQRKTPARPADPNSPAGRLLRETEEWAREKFQFPSLALKRVDTLKTLALNPEQLGTVKAAQALLGRADSTRTDFEQRLTGLALGPLVDSSTALVNRLAKTDPKTLGIAGVKDAVAQVQQAVDRVKQARGRLQALEGAARGSLGALQQGLADVDAARQRDYAFARGLLQLPGLDAPQIGGALFGPQSVDYFQRALYYARLTQRYVPPGLQPWNRPGPKRTRMDGTDVEFPREHEYPRFLLRQGTLDLALGAEGQHAVAGTVANLTSQPALLGRPATVALSGKVGGEHPLGIDLSGYSRHFGRTPLDSVAVRVSGVELPAFPFPGLPFGVSPGRSAVGFSFSLAGDRLAGSWEVTSDQVRWARDTSALASASLVENTVWRVVSGLSSLQVRADLGGTIANPTLRIRSNLDDAIAGRLRSLVGEEVAKAEARARAAVDQLVDQQVTAVRGRVGAFETQALARLPVERSRLDGVQQQLESQLKRLAGSAAGGIKLPKL
jgi:uncharacterized protein (TIGR03545 family)